MFSRPSCEPADFAADFTYAAAFFRFTIITRIPSYGFAPSE
jgi:hypothetical protein